MKRKQAAFVPTYTTPEGKLTISPRGVGDDGKVIEYAATGAVTAINRKARRMAARGNRKK